MENKYRAYIEWAKIILEVEIIDFKRKRVYCKTEMNKPNHCDFYNFDDIIVMQYTGLKDKNGVEIYEGDIIKVLGSICTVFWQQGAFKFQDIKNYNIQPLFDFATTGKSIAYEVIGNIYENKDLLSNN